MQVHYENLQKLNQPYKAQLQKALANVLDSGWLILGKQVEDFEQAFAKYNDANYCVGVASGLDALIISLLIFDFPKGSEVIVPANTCSPTVLAVINAGLTPILVEPDKSNYNISVETIAKAITHKTAAVLPVHLYGNPCQIDEIRLLCEQKNLKLIEDCAQACGAASQNRKVGTVGDIGAFSFYPTKTLGALGDAGAIITNDEALAQKARELRNYGSSQKYFNRSIGLNSRLDELQAAFLNVKLKDLDRLNQDRRERASIYFNHLSEGIILPSKENFGGSVFHIFPIRHQQRDALKAYLLEKGIGTEIHYPVAPHQQEAYQYLFKGQELPQSEEICKTILSLPISPAHGLGEIEFVAKTVNEWLNQQPQ